LRSYSPLAIALFVGCAFGTQTIDQIDPTSIPPNPTYTQDIAPIVDYYCLSCHDSAGPFFEEPSLENLDAVQAEFEGVVEEVFGQRTMPPGGAQQLSQREVEIIKRWGQQGFAP
jgi:uncharacterized membrane protein